MGGGRGLIASGGGTSLVGGETLFLALSRDTYPKNRPRLSVKRQVFSVLTSAYFRGPVCLKHTVYSSTSTLNISQYCMM